MIEILSLAAKGAKGILMLILMFLMDLRKKEYVYQENMKKLLCCIKYRSIKGRNFEFGRKNGRI